MSHIYNMGIITLQRVLKIADRARVEGLDRFKSEVYTFGFEHFEWVGNTVSEH
jgi:hypothetical protein